MSAKPTFLPVVGEPFPSRCGRCAAASAKLPHFKASPERGGGKTAGFDGGVNARQNITTNGSKILEDDSSAEGISARWARAEPWEDPSVSCADSSPFRGAMNAR